VRGSACRFFACQGKKSQEYFVYFKFEQRISGVKDPQSAEDAFNQWFLRSIWRITSLKLYAGSSISIILSIRWHFQLDWCIVFL